MDENRVREIVREELQKFFDEIILPAIQNIVKFEEEESESRINRKFEKIDETFEQIEKKFDKIDEKFDKVFTYLDRIAKDIDDMKTEKASGDYLFSLHVEKIEDHEKRIAVLETAQ
jgi:DNA anti-recombination protein RmuC